MNKQLSRSLLVISIAASLVLDTTPAMAQLEEVVVTARKRDETIMQVPATTTVIDAETLDQFAIQDMKSIATRVPGLNMGNGPMSSGVLISLRGIGTAANNPMIDQSVALVADGMQFTQGLAFGAAMFDMASVEVLKGPQALFFGKAAPGGVIATRSNDPADSFEASVRAGYELNAEEKLGEVIVSGPATDTLGLRLAAQYSDMDGYFENEAVLANDPSLVDITGNPSANLIGSSSLGAAPVSNKDFPEKEALLLKGTAVWDPTERFNARLKLNYQDVETQGTGGEPQLVSCPDGTDSAFGGFFGALQPVSFIGGESCKRDDKVAVINLDPAYFPGIYNGGVPFSVLEQDFGTLELNYDLGNDLALTSVTGFYDVRSSSMINGNLTTGYAGPFVIQGTLKRHDYTQELRLTSDYDGALNFLLGAFYQTGRTNFASILPANQAYLNTAISLGQGDLWAPVFGAQEYDVDIEAQSLFGQVLWTIMPELEFGVGARWTDETREQNVTDFSAEFYKYTAGLYPGRPIGTTVPVRPAKPRIDATNWSPEVSLTYTPTDTLTIFGNLKQAYKSGSFDVAGGAGDGDDNSFGDERVRGGELGLKSRLFDETVAVNATGYYYKYNDLQVDTNIFDPAGGIVGVRTVNAASAKVYGVDFDIFYAPTEVEGLSLFAAINWNKARYEDFEKSQCWSGQSIAQGCTIGADGNPYQDLSGEPMLRAPEWTGNYGFNYELPVDDMRVRLGTNASFSSSFMASTDNYPGSEHFGYQKISANVGLVGRDDRWMLELIGDNLTDKFTYGSCQPQPYADTFIFGKAVEGTGAAGSTPENACYVERGRSVWLRVTAKFF